MKYTVHGTVRIGVSVTVEAESEEEAMEAANDKWEGLSDYCGNGRPSGALVGTSDRNVRIETIIDEPEWTDVT